MKYVLIIGDGMADDPLNALSGLTPLEKAAKPTIDDLAKNGLIGTVQNIPGGYPPGSDTAIMSIFGCSPAKYYSGRAPLEAAAQGIALKAGDAAFRCNNIALSDADNFEDRLILSHSAGGIGGEDGKALVEYLFSHPEFKALADKAGMSINPTESYRHIAVQSSVDIKGLRLMPPHDHLRETVRDTKPVGCANADVLCEMLEKANEVLEQHPINIERRAQGKLPANGIWFWAEGTAALLPHFAEQFGHDGAVVSAVPLCHGIARLTGLDVITVQGATGELDTNFEGKVEAGLKALDKYDFVAVHLEAPDECTHNGDLPGKLQAIEWLDSRIVAPMIEGLRKRGEDFRVLILSDHKTLMEKNGAHGADPVPFMIYDSRETIRSGMEYSEKNGLKGVMLSAGTELMPMLFEL